MKNLQEKLANVQIEKLEERKEFTFYFCIPNPCGGGGTTNPPAGGGGTGTGSTGGGTNNA